MLNVAACVALPELERLRAEWDALLSSASNASIFATWEWVEACWRYPAPSRQPFVLVARNEQGRLVGVLPLARTSRLGFIQVLEVLGCTHHGYPMGDYGGLVAERGGHAAVWYAMLKFMKSKWWMLIDMSNCMAGPPEAEEQTARNYKAPADSLGVWLQVQSAEPCRVVPLPCTFDVYLAELSSNGRQNIRRKLRKLANDGHTIERVDAKDLAARTEALQALFELHQERWEDKEAGGGFPEGRIRDLHHHLAANLAERGYLDLRIVRSAEGNVVAVIYNYRYGDTVYYYHMGSSQSEPWTAYSLGTCLIADSIEGAINDGYKTFDLLRGDHDYKRHFGGYSTATLRVMVYRYNWLPRAEGLLRTLRGRLSDRAGVAMQAEPQAQ